MGIKAGSGFVPWNKTMTVQDELLIVKLYNDGKSSPEILDQFKGKFKTTKTIIDILKKYKIDRKEAWQYSSANHAAFANITTEKEAYALGIMITDGYVVPRGNSAQIGITCKDKYIAELISTVIGSSVIALKTEGVIMKTLPDGRVYRKSKHYRAVTDSPFILKNLANYGVVHRKSDKTYFPVISPELMPHMIRGLIDGDGFITIQKINCHIGLYGTAVLTYGLSQHFAELGIAAQKVPQYRTNTKYLHGVRYADYREITKIRNYLNPEGTQYRLERKWGPLEEWLNANYKD